MAINEDADIMCSNCGGILDIDPENPTVVCSFCGSCFSVSGLLNESETVKIERLRRDVELGRQNLELERIRQEEAHRNDNIRQIEASKKSFLSKISIVFASISMLMCITGFVNGVHLMGIIAGIQCILFAVTFFIGQQVIPVKARKIHILPFTLAIMLEIPFAMLIAASDEFQPSNNSLIISWDEIVLSDRLPKLDSENGYMMKNTKTELMMNVYNIPIKRYYDFVEDCKEMGYTLESDENNESYRAYAQDGYKIYLRYSVLHDGTVDVNLFAPKEGTAYF